MRSIIHRENIDINKNGEFIEYYENGEMDWKDSYKNGKLNGKSYHYYENGKLSCVSEWVDDCMVGEFRSYSENESGELIEYRLYNDNNELIKHEYHNCEINGIPMECYDYLNNKEIKVYKDPRIGKYQQLFDDCLQEVVQLTNSPESESTNGDIDTIVLGYLSDRLSDIK